MDRWALYLQLLFGVFSLFFFPSSFFIISFFIPTCGKLFLSLLSFSVLPIYDVVESLSSCADGHAPTLLTDYDVELLVGVVVRSSSTCFSFHHHWLDGDGMHASKEDGALCTKWAVNQILLAARSHLQRVMRLLIYLVGCSSRIYFSCFDLNWTPSQSHLLNSSKFVEF